MDFILASAVLPGTGSGPVRAQQVVDPVQKAAEIRRRTHAYRRVLLQQTEKDLEVAGAQCVTGHARKAVKRSAMWEGW